jgi:hypothetical protein
MDYKGDKNLQPPSFGGEVKPWAPCRKFLRHVEYLLKYDGDTDRQSSAAISPQVSALFATRCLLQPEQRNLVDKSGTNQLFSLRNFDQTGFLLPEVKRHEREAGRSHQSHGKVKNTWSQPPSPFIVCACTTLPTGLLYEKGLQCNDSHKHYRY